MIREECVDGSQTMYTTGRPSSSRISSPSTARRRPEQGGRMGRPGAREIQKSRPILGDFGVYCRLPQGHPAWIDVMNEVTRILCAVEQGDAGASERLLPLVYEELRLLAAQKLAHETPGQTLQPTALVHEAYLRLVDVEQAQHWNSRGHFFAAAA